MKTFRLFSRNRGDIQKNIGIKPDDESGFILQKVDRTNYELSY
jgi:hypothetical protein